MKNLSIVLNVVLLIAVAVLYVLHFSSPAKVQTAANSGSDSSSVYANVAIAYVNSDSLLTKYDFMNEIQANLESKQKRLEAEYRNRAEGLQKEIESFQRTAGNMTMAQAKALEEDLMKKQQNLMRYQENLSQDLMRDEARYNNELYDNVAEFLKIYGREKGLQLVLTYSKGSGVLFANDSLDITNDVIIGLNESYNATKDSKKK